MLPENVSCGIYGNQKRMFVMVLSCNASIQETEIGGFQV